MDTRFPAVEGRFYPGSKREIEALIEQIDQRNRYEELKMSDIDVIGVILPHAGHIYSGYQTIPFFKYLCRENIIPETLIIIHPNHSGYGAPIAMDKHKYWNNAMGSMEIDKELAKLLPYPEDSRAHDNEHSCEVILPFAQYYINKHDLRILPISMSRQTANEAKKLAENIEVAAKELNRDVLVIASSDFSHFQTAKEGYRQDQFIIDQIVADNIEGLEKVVYDHRISACGTGPIMSLMAYSRIVSQEYRTKILARGHSGEVSPSSSVVDYISMLFYY